MTDLIDEYNKLYLKYLINKSNITKKLSNFVEMNISCNLENKEVKKTK